MKSADQTKFNHLKSTAWVAFVIGLGISFACAAVDAKTLYTFKLTQNGTPASYDEAMAVASLQGIINRDSPELYLLSNTNSRPQFWLDMLSKDGRWLQGRKLKPLPDLDALVKLA